MKEHKQVKVKRRRINYVGDQDDKREEKKRRTKNNEKRRGKEKYWIEKK